RGEAVSDWPSRLGRGDSDCGEEWILAAGPSRPGSNRSPLLFPLLEGRPRRRRSPHQGQGGVRASTGVPGGSWSLWVLLDASLEVLPVSLNTVGWASPAHRSGLGETRRFPAAHFVCTPPGRDTSGPPPSAERKNPPSA